VCKTFGGPLVGIQYPLLDFKITGEPFTRTRVRGPVHFVAVHGGLFWHPLTSKVSSRVTTRILLTKTLLLEVEAKTGAEWGQVIIALTWTINDIIPLPT
jgi:hypothetical protein